MNGVSFLSWRIWLAVPILVLLGTNACGGKQAPRTLAERERQSDKSIGSGHRGQEPARQAQEPHPVLAWPVRGREILSRFGASRRTHRHTGLDIRGKGGDPVMAAAAGSVTFSSSMSGYGKTVIINHGGGLQTLYAHNKALLVHLGEHVSRGQEIATVGRTGNASTEHCHFEVRRHNVAVDPLTYLSQQVADRRR